MSKKDEQTPMELKQAVSTVMQVLDTTTLNIRGSDTVAVAVAQQTVRDWLKEQLKETPE